MLIKDMENFKEKYFDSESRPMGGLNNMKFNKIIFTNDYRLAEYHMDKFYIDNKSKAKLYHKSKDDLYLKFSDNSRMTWVKLNLQAKAYRCSSALIDGNIRVDDFYELLLIPCQYCGKNDVEII